MKEESSEGGVVMVIGWNVSYFCYFVVTEEGTGKVIEYCAGNFCSGCIFNKVRRELKDSTLKINVNPGVDIGLTGEEQI